ncbi:unnamed protein product [Cladocopium goreaui]|uniref:Lactonase drp35 n=1 Tax=Cladocopium goreaui TaxID=2562237 RepID=A0A9P1CUD1_9DINO|nr:unnamed protein product [Cladocopium goreaui]
MCSAASNVSRTKCSQKLLKGTCRLSEEVVSVTTSQSCGFEGVSFNNFVDVMTFPIRDGESRDEDLSRHVGATVATVSVDSEMQTDSVWQDLELEDTPKGQTGEMKVRTSTEMTDSYQVESDESDESLSSDEESLERKDNVPNFQEILSEQDPIVMDDETRSDVEGVPVETEPVAPTLLGVSSRTPTSPPARSSVTSPDEKDTKDTKDTKDFALCLEAAAVQELQQELASLKRVHYLGIAECKRLELHFVKSWRSSRSCFADAERDKMYISTERFRVGTSNSWPETAFQIPPRPPPGLEKFGPKALEIEQKGVMLVDASAMAVRVRPQKAVSREEEQEVGLVRREAKMESDLLPFSDASTTDADSMSRCSRCVQLDEASSSPQVAGSPSRAQSNGAPCAIQLQRMLEDSTPDYPSKGSAAHHLGLCKPCDFKCRASCRFGYECMFCHICGPAESRQWKRGRKSFWRQAWTEILRDTGGN